MLNLQYLLDTEIVLPGQAAVKKNTKRIFTNKGPGGVRIIYSKAYTAWLHRAEAAIAHYGHPEPIDFPVNVQYRFYLAEDRKVDLTNLIEGPQDLLVAAMIIIDDNYKIVASLDGSGIAMDRDNPRTTITITRKA